MAIAVAKLEGEDVPEAQRGKGVEVVFRVTDEHGGEHFCTDDVSAAKLAVALSEAARDQ